MEKQKSNFQRSLLSVLIVLVSVGGGAYIYFISPKEQPLPVTTVPPNPVNIYTPSSVDNKINSDSVSKEFVGKWVTAGNDFMYLEFNLYETGEFKEKSYFLPREDNVSEDDVFNGTGSWELVEKDNIKYLLFTYNQNIHPPTDEKTIEEYKGDGHEFIGDNQILLKITTEQNETYFRYHGNLMLKSVDILE